MNALKIKLQKPKPIGWVAPGNKIIPLLTARPYYKGKRGTYTHVIRSGSWFSIGHRKPHTIFIFWCGLSGSGERGLLMSSLASDAVLCATCEGRATGAGVYGDRIINGRRVMFDPRLYEIDAAMAGGDHGNA